MSKFYKQRSKNVNDAIKQRIIGAVKNFEGKYTESQVFKHSLSKGEYKNNQFRSSLENFYLISLQFYLARLLIIKVMLVLNQI